MFWTGDAYSTRRSQTTNTSYLKFSAPPTESGQSNNPTQTQNPNSKESIQ